MAYAPRILVIEDEAPVGRLIERILEDDGYFVTKVKTARHGLLKLRETSFDLAIVDMSLPDADGPVLVRDIRAEFGCLRILAVSGYMHGPMRGMAMAAGADLTLEKPFTVSGLKDAVYRLLDPSCSWMGMGRLAQEVL